MQATSGIVEYEVVALGDGEFAVRVTSPANLPREVGGFGSAEEAELWILRQSESGDDHRTLPDHI